MQDGFYLADETHRTLQGGVVKQEGVLYFRQARSGFDGKADKEHVKHYPGLFAEFQKAHPDYVLPDKFRAEEIGQPSVEVVPVAPAVESPVEVAPAE